MAVSHKGDRFCFYIPEPGSVYVHENMKENEFIKVLIELVQKHDCTKVKLLDLFTFYWKKTESQEMDNGEFDFYIRFLDKADDTNYYCFKDEGFHFIYHILTNKKTCAYIVKKLLLVHYKGGDQNGFEKLFNRCPAHWNSNERY